MEIMLFTSPHSRMEGLTTKSTLGPRTALYFSITQEEERKKIHLLNVVLGTDHFLKVYMGAILLYGSSAETL